MTAVENARVRFERRGYSFALANRWGRAALFIAAEVSGSRWVTTLIPVRAGGFA